MATTFKNLVASINACAAHFALQGYYVNASFSKERLSVECTIFFEDRHQVDRLTKALQCFADDGDKIQFRELNLLPSGMFYTLRLVKESQK